MSVIGSLVREFQPGHRLLSLRGNPSAPAIGYLAVLTFAEATSTLVETRIGLVLHAIVLVALLMHSAVTVERATGRLLLALSFAPLIRLLSYSLPLAGLPVIYWYLVVSAPLFVAALISIRVLSLSRLDVGLSARGLPLQLLVGLSGLLFGYAEYQILRPMPLAPSLTIENLWLPALILLVSTGFLEELVFRGILQRTAIDALGWLGIAYVATLFAVLHLGYQSALDVLFVFVAGLFFGGIVARTGSLVGVTIAHGMTNIMLFLILPHLVTVT